MSEAKKRAVALMGDLNELSPSSGSLPEGLRLFSVGQGRTMLALAELERRTRRSVVNMQPRLLFDPEDSAYELHDRSLARGISLTTIIPPRFLQFHPLLTSFGLEILLGPVVMNCLLVDGEVAILPGLTTEDDEPTAWLATGGEFLDRARALVEATVAESIPAMPEGADPPLNRRQFDVARAVCLGRTDAAIARQLGISPRTVARDVSVILQVTGARSRSEAILNMLGRGLNSRP